MPPRAPRLVALLTGLLLAVAAGAQGPLDFDGAPADEAVVAWRPVLPGRLSETSEMINRVQGVAAILDAPSRRLLASASRRAPEIGWPAELEPAGYLHARKGDVVRVLAIARTSDGVVLVRDLGGDPAHPTCREFGEDQFDAVLAQLRAYPGPFRAGPPPESAGQSVPIPQPYRASHIILDEATIRDRLSGGRETALPATDRYLRDETLHLRLPSGYDPSSPAGLLVWVSADDSGRPPAVFWPCADELGLILVGADESGNQRLSTDRYQLALDGVATVSARHHVDPGRVYVCGISGGGRIASHMVACFPDVFTGAVPIVGLDYCEHIPLGDGRFIPAGYRRPGGAAWRLLRERRIAPISGELDFNYRGIVNAVRLMRRDGLDIRLFEYEDMAHTLPTAERFAEAMRWVDEPARTARDEAWREAAEDLASYEARHGGGRAESEAQRRILGQITITGPWSPAAWRACDLLGVVPAPAEGPRP
ncbi:MAG TPA: PHB depolymerase family esterase [Phycisphaerales bacterium]|nr:PHB depolymerase family esterase [Phycisphaerales bacterium]